LFAFAFAFALDFDLDSRALGVWNVYEEKEKTIFSSRTVDTIFVFV